MRVVSRVRRVGVTIVRKLMIKRRSRADRAVTASSEGAAVVKAGTGLRPSTTASSRMMAAYAAALSITAPSMAKTPGEVHCYNGICHRVKSVEEMQLLVGHEAEEITSFYDTAEHDRMNVGTITSSGEEFDADSDKHAASSLYPDGTELLIWNPKNRQAAHIRVNDFGPFYMLRTIDVTRGVAEKLEFTKSGVARLKVIVIWAPNPDAARFKRHRSYPDVEGYLGQLDYDQLTALQSRLIATGPKRNGDESAVVAVAQPKFSLKALPAFAAATSGNERARIKAAIANVPLYALTAQTPSFVVANLKIGPNLAASSPYNTFGSAMAIAAASSPTPSIVTARDSQVAVAVADLATRMTNAATTLSASVSVGTAPYATSAGYETVSARTWAPSTLLWQQLLLALGIMSVAGVSWRTRSSLRQVPVRARHSAGLAQATAAPATFVMPAVAEVIQGPAPFQFDNVISLPLLPRRPVTRSMDELRDEAAAHMENYAFAAAEADYRQLLAVRLDTLGAADPLTASAERALADCLREQGRFTIAERHYQRALNAMAAAVGDDHPATADVLDSYAVCLLKQGKGGEAERAARRALTVRRTYGTRTREYAVTLSIIAEAARAQGDLAAAEADHRIAWSLFIAVSGQDSLDAAASMTSIGTILGDLGRFGAAEELLNAGTRILSSICGHEHPLSAMSYALLGDLYLQAGAYDAARTMHDHALTIREETLGPRHPDTIETLLALAMIATRQYRQEEAHTYIERGIDGLHPQERYALGPQSRIRSLLVALSQHHDTNVIIRIAAE